jgi:multisubunit Na+/H+ antiporter MnhE subunit
MNVSKLNDQEKVLFANLITMTPGTFVIAIEGDNFLIHALNRKDLEFKNNSEITKLLRKMRGVDEKNELENKIVITGLPKEKL